MKAAILILFGFIYSSSVFAQWQHAIHFSTKDGLPCKEVYNILQDKKGFIWLGTEKGLCRFDGVHFQVFSCSGMSSLSGSYLKEDRYGRIWYMTFDGFLYFVENETMHPLSNELSTAYEYALIADRLWMLHNRDLMGYDIKTLQKVETKTSIEAMLLFQVDTLFEIFNLTGTKHLMYNQEGTVILDEPRLNEYYKTLTWKDQVYNVYNHNESVSLYKNKQPFAQIPKKGELTGCGLSKNNFWFTTKSGCYVYSMLQKQHRVLLPKEVCTYFMKDMHDNTWVGTLNGLYLFPNQHHFQFKPAPSTTCKLKKFKNDLFAYDETGCLYVFNAKADSFEILDQLESKSAIYDFYVTPKGDIGNLFNRKNRKQIVKEIDYNKQVIHILSSGSKELVDVDDKYVAVASATGSEMFLKSNLSIASLWDSVCKVNEYQKEIAVKNQYSFFGNFRSKSVAFSKFNHAVYFATSVGVKVATPTSLEELLFEGKPIYANKIGCIADKVFMLLTDGSILVKHGNKELVKINQVSHMHAIQNIVCAEPFLFLLANNSVYYLDIGQLDSSTEHWKFTYLSLPIPENLIHDIEFFNNEFFIATDEYIIRYKVTKNQPHYIANPFYITSVSANKDVFHHFSNLKFAHDQNDIVVKYSILNYINTATDIQFKVNDAEWKHVDPTQRSISFASLGSGSYRILFKLNNELQKENIQFMIDKPWYLAKVFLVFCGLGILGITYWVYQQKLKINQKKSLLLLEKIKLETDLRQSMLSSIKSQMNPHFLFNALNTIQSYIITEDKKNASSYLSKFSKLTRKILDMSDNETISLQEEVDALMLYVELEKMRFNDLNFTIEFENVHDIATYLIPSMIIQPYVENAIKHGLLHKMGDKQLFINIHKTATHLCIKIEDNGIGRLKSKIINKNKINQHRSFASDANMKRIELLNAGKDEISVEYIDKQNAKGEAAGTIVKIKLPIKTIK